MRPQTRTLGRKLLLILSATVTTGLGCGDASTSTFAGVRSSQRPTQLGNAQQVLKSSLDLDASGSEASVACVTSTVATQLSRVDLVFVYDKSGSMGDPAEGGDANVKWIPLEKGMSAFFADPTSQWISASLEFFPAAGDLQTTCSYPYQNPDVPLGPLSASSPILTRIASTMPQGGTPTLPALAGGLAYAQVLALASQDKVAVVLVTDGEPGFYSAGPFFAGCANNDLAHVESAADQAVHGSPSIPTYVIGVGTAIDRANANAIASAGGTSQAFMIAVNDPSTTASSLIQALASIRTQSFSCALPFPAPPPGQVINPGQVNIVFTKKSGGAAAVIAQDASCANGMGWHYDDPVRPTTIELCPATCSDARADGGDLSLAFGCSTTTIVPR